MSGLSSFSDFLQNYGERLKICTSLIPQHSLGSDGQRKERESVPRGDRQGREFKPPWRASLNLLVVVGSSVVVVTTVVVEVTSSVVVVGSSVVVVTTAENVKLIRQRLPLN